MTRKLQIVFAVCVAMVLGWAGIASASGNDHHRLEEITVEIVFHHLGDGNNFLDYVVPDNEGVYWETTVWLRRNQLRKASTAHLELYLFNNAINSLLINGKEYALPNTDPIVGAMLPSVGKTIISIPIGLLHKRANSIAFQVNNFLGSGGADDFEFGDVVLVLSR